MYLLQLGQQLRALRRAKGWSQGQLARLSGVARETISRIENGTYNDIGVKKLVTLLELVGGELVAEPKPPGSGPDFVSRAVVSANVSHRDRLHADELIQAVLTGTIPPGKQAHLQTILAELSPTSQEGLVDQIGQMAEQADKARQGVRRLRARLSNYPEHS